jgi:hypothetical protein
MAAPGISSKGPQSIADWLPLLGSILQALSGMAEDDRPATQSPAGARESETRPGKNLRPDRAA